MGAVYVVQERSTDIFPDPDFWLFKNEPHYDLTEDNDTSEWERRTLHKILIWEIKNPKIVMIVQHSECNWCHWNVYSIVHVTMGKFMFYMFYYNKKICLKNLQNWIF